MRFNQETYDGIARRLAAQNTNMLVPWWLMASHAYYDLDDPFLTDGCYDWLCTELDAKWDQVEHDHKRLIDRDALKAGTGYTLAGKMPTRIVHATRHLMSDYSDPSEIGLRAAPQLCDNIDDLLGISSGPVGIEDLL